MVFNIFIHWTSNMVFNLFIQWSNLVCSFLRPMNNDSLPISSSTNSQSSVHWYGWKMKEAKCPNSAVSFCLFTFSHGHAAWPLPTLLRSRQAIELSSLSYQCTSISSSLSISLSLSLSCWIFSTYRSISGKISSLQSHSVFVFVLYSNFFLYFSGLRKGLVCSLQS
jgi:hypothetical protein